MEPLSDAALVALFRSVRTIACVGFSPNPGRPSHYVSEYLVRKGFRVIPVNPGHAGETFLGETVAARLPDIKAEVDMIDVFRRSEHVPPVVDEALAAFRALKVIWLQLGIHHAEAAAKARACGVTVVEDRCPMIEFPRLEAAIRGGAGPAA